MGRRNLDTPTTTLYELQIKIINRKRKETKSQIN